MIPILGPSDVRDGIGRIGDGFMSPLSYVNNNYIRYGIYGVDVIDIRYRLLPQDRLLDESYDPYAFLRNAYLQRRQYEVTDGKLSDEDRKKQEQDRLDEEKRIIEESGGDDTSAPAQPSSTPPGTPPQPSTTPPEPPK
jgi:phospholipid-binding lipoprotein MlaA